MRETEGCPVAKVERRVGLVRSAKVQQIFHQKVQVAAGIGNPAFQQEDDDCCRGAGERCRNEDEEPVSRSNQGTDSGHQLDVACPHTAKKIKRQVHRHSQQHAFQGLRQTMLVEEVAVQSETGCDAAQIEPVWNAAEQAIVNSRRNPQAGKRQENAYGEAKHELSAP